MTLVRLASDRYLYVTGTAFGSHNLAWLRQHLPDGGRTSTTSRSSRTCYCLWGPRARDILQPLTKTDLSHEAFPYMRAREIAVGNVPLLASRVTYVGELGWELYAPAEYGLGLYDVLSRRPARSTACAAAATARSSRCGSRRAIAPGAPTSRPRRRRSRRAWASPCGSTRTRRSSARRRCAPSAPPAGRPSGSRASCSTIRARSAWAPSRCASTASCAVASRRAATAVACGAASRSRTCRPRTPWPARAPRSRSSGSGYRPRSWRARSTIRLGEAHPVLDVPLLVDYHLHLAPDGVALGAAELSPAHVALYAESARERGIDHVCLTEHCHRFRQAAGLLRPPVLERERAGRPGRLRRPRCARTARPWAAGSSSTGSRGARRRSRRSSPRATSTSCSAPCTGSAVSPSTTPTTRSGRRWRPTRSGGATSRRCARRRPPGSSTCSRTSTSPRCSATARASP